MGGYRRFRESWGCYAQVVMGGSGEVGVVMSRSGANGLMCGISMQSLSVYISLCLPPFFKGKSWPWGAGLSTRLALSNSLIPLYVLATGVQGFTPTGA